ncbi:MAG: formimidoylglutamate deiminase, partial [Gaiellaceae bacterium]|nr:formimidoylglutamate deiminase [Gaiellaceae bacterium]
MTVLAPELLLDAGGARRGALVVEDGRIAAVLDAPPAGAERLPGRALLPGFVDAHSHAFQRA